MLPRVELLDLSKLFYGFLYVVTWICKNDTWRSLKCYTNCQNCLLYKYFKLLNRCDKVVTCISRPLPDKTKLFACLTKISKIVETSALK